MTTEELSSLLDYNPDTGVFTWRVSRRGHVKAGDVAKNLGRFNSAEEAGKAAKKARTEFYGVFAPN